MVSNSLVQMEAEDGWRQSIDAKWVTPVLKRTFRVMQEEVDGGQRHGIGL